MSEKETVRLSEEGVLRGDFSLEIPKLISKLEFLASSFLNAYEHEDFVPYPSFYWGASAILDEIAEELGIIGEALYPSGNN